MKRKTFTLAACALVLLLLASCGGGSSSASADPTQEPNALYGYYYVGSLGHSVQVVRFDGDGVVEWVDCGLGRSSDKRTKYYGTYDLDGRKLSIEMSGQPDFLSESSLACVVHDDGASITIDGEKFTSCTEDDLGSETVAAFD